MSFCARAALRVTRAALPVILAGCTVFESPISEFPDAGPDGPDSLYAGVGRGIPFGEFGRPPELFRAPVSGAVLPVSRAGVGAVLRAAQAGRVRMVLNLAGPGDDYSHPDGTFDLAAWKARIDAYRDVDFSPYVVEGLVLAHFLIDEPRAPGTWGGRPVSRADVEEMARYSKSIWPALPTAVRVTPAWLGEGDTTYAHLDIAWAQWAGPDHGAGSGRTPEEFRDENVAHAKALGLGLIFGMNYLDGGDGSSGIQRAAGAGWWQMSAAEVTRVGTVLAETPYACALLSWRYEPGFEGRPEIRAALDSVARVAAARGGTSCVRGDSTVAPAPGPLTVVRPAARAGAPTTAEGAHHPTVGP
jgi:hypothetical protein